MGFLDKLSGLFKDAFPKLESLVSVKVQINCDNSKEKIEYNQESKDLSINLTKLEPAEKQQFGPLLRDDIQENDDRLIEKEAYTLLEDFKRADTASVNQEKILFLREAIPAEDIAIWRASLFLANCYKQGKSIDQLKEDIFRKYGERGRKISNLCSAEYLEINLIPYFGEINRIAPNKKEAIRAFRRIYKTIVKELQITIFVSRWDKVGVLTEDIEKKILKNWQYGVKFLNVHAISKSNIKKALKAIKKIEQKYNISTQIEKKTNVLTARMEVKSNPLFLKQDDQ